jgi:hypothetical protein
MESRFDRNIDLASLQHLLSELDNKIENTNIENYKFQSLMVFTDKNLMQHKHRLLSELKRNINETIAKFNKETRQSDKFKEINETIKLMVNLHEQIRLFLKLNLSILKKPTSPAKNIAKNLNYYGSKVVTLGSIFAMSGPGLILPAVGWYASSKFSENMDEQMGLSDENVETITLINNLLKTLENTYTIFVEILEKQKIKPLALLQTEGPPSTLSTQIINTFLHPVPSHLKPDEKALPAESKHEVLVAPQTPIPDEIEVLVNNEVHETVSCVRLQN